MRLVKVRARNAPCPCGSGKKRKVCCGAGGGYTQLDRNSALDKLDEFIDEVLEEEEQAAYDELWGDLAGREDELPESMLPASTNLHDAWFAFDRPLEDGRLVADLFLEQVDLTSGER